MCWCAVKQPFNQSIFIKTTKSTVLYYHIQVHCLPTYMVYHNYQCSNRYYIVLCPVWWVFMLHHCIHLRFYVDGQHSIISDIELYNFCLLQFLYVDMEGMDLFHFQIIFNFLHYLIHSMLFNVMLYFVRALAHNLFALLQFDYIKWAM